MSLAMQKLTPVLMVEAIEPCLPFWERLGFANVAQVPHGEGLGFVILVGGAVELMYQTRASVADDLPVLAEAQTGGSFLFIEVADLDAVIAALGAAPLLHARRTTFYGMDEILVREPGGHAVTFAQKR